MQPVPLGEEYWANRSYGATEEVELSCALGENYYRYRINTQPEQMVFSPQVQQGPDREAAFAKNEDPRNWNVWQPQNGLLPHPIWLRLEIPRLREHKVSAVSPDSNPRFMNVDGSGMHLALASMALEGPDQWKILQEDLRRIVPAVQRLRHTPHSELLFDTVNGKSLKAHQVSEGTLLTLGLLTAIHGVNKPGILLLDDMDRALHPKAQRDLIDLLRGVQTTNPDIQIVGSTHSPYLLGRLEPSEVQVTYLGEDGSTVCEPLTHHPKYSKWKDEFHPGEMWSLFGEKWVAELTQRFPRIDSPGNRIF